MKPLPTICGLLNEPLLQCSSHLVAICLNKLYPIASFVTLMIHILFHLPFIPVLPLPEFFN